MSCGLLVAGGGRGGSRRAVRRLSVQLPPDVTSQPRSSGSTVYYVINHLFFERSQLLLPPDDRCYSINLDCAYARHDTQHSCSSPRAVSSCLASQTVRRLSQSRTAALSAADPKSPPNCVLTAALIRRVFIARLNHNLHGSVRFVFYKADLPI